jgi:hypothetical protein
MDQRCQLAHMCQIQRHGHSSGCSGISHCSPQAGRLAWHVPALLASTSTRRKCVCCWQGMCLATPAAGAQMVCVLREDSGFPALRGFCDQGQGEGQVARVRERGRWPGSGRGAGDQGQGEGQVTRVRERGRWPGCFNVHQCQLLHGIPYSRMASE